MISAEENRVEKSFGFGEHQRFAQDTGVILYAAR